MFVNSVKEIVFCKICDIEMYINTVILNKKLLLFLSSYQFRDRNLVLYAPKFLLSASILIKRIHVTSSKCNMNLGHQTVRYYGIG